MFKKIAALWLLTLSLAFGQSSPGLYYGQVPTAAQWNSYFAAKQDVLGFTPVNKAGDVMQGPLVTAASSSSAAGFNLPQGAAPSSPNNGDVWTTSTGVFVRINGVTVGPLDAGGTNAIDVWLLIGSSNTVGQGNSTQSPVPPATARMYCWDIHDQPLVDPVCSAVSGSANWNANTGSMWPAFAISRGVPTVVVQTAVSGSTQSTACDFLVGNGNWQSTTGGSNYANSLAAINAALAAYTAAGYTPIFRGIIQTDLGVNDGANIDAGAAGCNQAAYIAAFNAMAANFRSAMIGGKTYPHLPIYMALIGTNINPTFPDSPGYLQVRQAQLSIIATDLNTQIVNVDALSFAARGLIQTNSVHPFQAGYNEWGAQIGASVLPFIPALTPYRVYTANTAPPQLPPSGTVLQVNGSDNANPLILLDSFGTGTGQIIIRSAATSGLAPSAIQSGSNIGIFASRGYGTSGYSTHNNGTLLFTATQNWTDANQGTSASVFVTANNANTPTLALFADQDRTIKLPAYGAGLAHFDGSGKITSSSVSLIADVSGLLPIANGGTNASTQQNALNNLMPTPTRAGDVAYYNGSNWVALAGNNSGTNCFQENSSGVPSWATCGAVTSVSNSDSTLTISPTTGAVVASLNLAHANTWTAKQTISGASFTLSGAISASAWTTAGIRHADIVGTITDTSSSGTVATMYGSVSGGDTYAASSSTTYTNAFSWYFLAPVNGSNVTITNKWALGADSMKIGTSNQMTVTAAGAVSINSLTLTNALSVGSGGTGATSLTANAFLTGNGASAINAVAITGLVLGNGGSAPTAYGGTSCTNQFPRSLNASGAATCASVANTDLVNSSVTYGTTAVALGASSTSIAGLTALSLTSASTATIDWNSDTYIGRAAAASLRLGQADAASPVAQTLGVQNVVAGTSNTAGAAFVIAGSQGTGTGIGGSISLKVAPAGGSGTSQNALVSEITILGNGNIGFGTETNPQFPFVYSANATTGVNSSNSLGLSGFLGPFTLSATGSITGFNAVSFASSAVNNLIRIDTSASAPSNLQSGDTIGVIGWGGWGAGALQGGRARILALTSETWTTTFGAYFQFDTTAAGGSRAQAMRIMGGVIIGTGTTDPGVGNLAFASLAFSGTAPTLSAGFCTSPSVSQNNGTVSFEITVGSSCAAGTGTITLPAASHKWTCVFVDVTNPNTHVIRQTGGTTTTVTVQDYSGTAGTTQNMASSDVIQANCAAY